MITNRDIAILFLKAWGKKNLQICDPLAGTGVRSLRFLKEAGEYSKIVYANDKSHFFIRSMKKNLLLNNIPSTKLSLSHKEASVWMLESSGFDYIDIDPFGSPNPFLDASIRRLSRRGILAVTATDTSALCGTHPRACLRKYWAIPQRIVHMHELGLRILIRKVQLIGAQYDRALLPLVSYADQHYMRVYLCVDKKKNAVDAILKQHGMWNQAGPLWLGPMQDSKILESMHRLCPLEWKKTVQLLGILCNESHISSLGFHDIHTLARKYKLASLPSVPVIISALNQQGFVAARTHLSQNGIKTNCSEEEFVRILQQ